MSALLAYQCFWDPVVAWLLKNQISFFAGVSLNDFRQKRQANFGSSTFDFQICVKDTSMQK